MGRVAREKLSLAAAVAFGGAPAQTAWERRIADQQVRVRRLYLAQARLLQTSGDAQDRELGAKVEAYVRSLQSPDTERLALARSLRAANERLRSSSPGRPGKDRG
jgi:hypothetical protein